MNKQILLIRGGMSFKNNDDFYIYLKTTDISLDKKGDIWSDLLQNDLGNNYNVITPIMPSKHNADYIAWSIWFERYLKLFKKDDLILIGHSLGGTFLLKYLSENKIDKKISKLLLVAPWVINDDELPKLSSFEFDISNIEKISEICMNIHLWQSKDDIIVSMNNANLIKKNLSNLHCHLMEDRGHFIDEKFPELLEEIIN